MSTAVFTPLLAEGRCAQLDLGLAGSAPCRITGFAGPQVFLAVEDRLFADGEAHAGYLLLDGGDEHIQALRGKVRRIAPGRAVMQLTDPFSGQRRLFSRAPLVLPAHVGGASGGEWDTFTRDVSAGGVRLARQSGWDGGDECTLTLRLGDDLRISVAAEVCRVSEDSLGLRFTRIEPEHRALLAELAVAYHST
jgi:PilZ domain